MEGTAQYIEENINRLIQKYKIPIKTSATNESVNSQKDLNSEDQEIDKSEYSSPLKSLDPGCTNPIQDDKNSGLSNGNTLKRSLSVNAAQTCNETLKKIFGRDPSFPDALNDLIQPLFCKLCNVQLNSTKVSLTHYDSKNHVKKAMRWLTEWSKETGEPIPKIPKLTKESGLTGTNAYRCDACDLPLSSLQHANQHYNGKKHKMVVANLSNPSGSGYYDSNGKWVRTPTKIKTDSRYGIGEAFRNPPEKTESTPEENTTESTKKEKDSITRGYSNSVNILNQMVNSSAGQATNTNPFSTDFNVTAIKNQSGSSYCQICDFPLLNEAQLQQHLSGKRHKKSLQKLSNENDASIASSKLPLDETKPTLNESENSKSVDAKAVHCIICNISVTSESQMEIHMQGSKHAKKLKQLGEPPYAPPNDTVLASVHTSSDNDLSVYRTPSGNYYCKTCNFTLQDSSQFKQHLSGKRHKKHLKTASGNNEEKTDGE